MEKIYVFGIYTGTNSYGKIWDAEPCGDVMGFAVDGIVVDPEDGREKLNGIASHLSSGESWCKYDMGITSDVKHKEYETAHPDGYELEFIGFFNNIEDPFSIIKNKLDNTPYMKNLQA